jgi:hypothetical protein
MGFHTPGCALQSKKIHRNNEAATISIRELAQISGLIRSSRSASQQQGLHLGGSLQHMLYTCTCSSTRIGAGAQLEAFATEKATLARIVRSENEVY